MHTWSFIVLKQCAARGVPSLMYVQLLDAIAIKSINEEGKWKERYLSFGLGLENFTGHITPGVLGKSRFTHDYCSYPSPSALNSASRTAWEWSKLSLATELVSTARPLFSTSWRNDSMWAAMLLGWDHCQCQSRLPAHHCGLQSATCNTKIHNCRAEWHLPDDIKELRAILTGFLGVPLCRGKSWETETKGQYLCIPCWWLSLRWLFWNKTLPGHSFDDDGGQH